MPLSIAQYFDQTQDECQPPIHKPFLSAYDNYQIYDICCVDVWFETIKSDGTIIKSPVEKQLSFLAIQAYNPTVIKCDFMAIVEAYK